MDTRIALKKHTKLKFYNSSQGVCVYTIQKEVARGATCIVYEASYENNAGSKKFVRIKECYPFSLMMQRMQDGSLYVEACDQEAFIQYKQKMLHDFNLGNTLFHTKGLTNYTTNSVDIYALHNTVYVVTMYQEGQTLTHCSFSSLKDCIRVVYSIASVIDKLHKKGYVYLDVKPDNIFVLSETTQMIQLFDFDSILPLDVLSNIEDTMYKISYTKGFSALELQMGSVSKIGKHMDVYAIGAILFYLLFHKVANAMDGELDAVYDYQQSRYATYTYQDELYEACTDFFHYTLSNFYLDRYQDMHQVMHKLKEIEKLADTSVAYIVSSFIMYTKPVFGREKEINDIYTWLQNKKENILFVSGMGGIGKTSIVKKCLSMYMEEFTTILYVHFHQSLKQTMIDDQQFIIHTVKKYDQESMDEYFIRKLHIAKKLTYHQRTVLIIDNFTGVDVSGLDELMKLHWKVIIISRHVLDQTYPYMYIQPIQKNKICMQ